MTEVWAIGTTRHWVRVRFNWEYKSYRRFNVEFKLYVQVSRAGPVCKHVGAAKNELAEFGYWQLRSCAAVGPGLPV